MHGVSEDEAALEVKDALSAGGTKWIDPWMGTTSVELGDVLYHHCGSFPLGACPPELVISPRISDGAVLDCSSPCTFPSGTLFSPICQGRLCDLWFLNGLAALCATENGRECLKSLVVSESLSHGIYTVKFWKQDKWVYINIDDRIPCDMSGSPLYSRCQDPNQVWVMVLEKAYAKLHGSYLNIENGLIEDALIELTGGICYRGPMPNQWTYLLERISPVDSMSTSSGHVVGVMANKKSSSIASARVFGVAGIVEHQNKQLVKLQDMWQMSRWDGDWCTSSPNWTTYPEIKEIVNSYDTWTPDTLYMTLEEFSHNFSTIFDCSLCSGSTISFQGQFKLDSQNCGSGGSANDEMKWLTNPMLAFSLEDTADIAVEFSQNYDPRTSDYYLVEEHRGFQYKAMDDEECSTVFDKHGVGLHLCRLGSFHSGKHRIQRHHRIMASAGYRNVNKIGCHAKLIKGDYVIVPSTFCESLYGLFSLKVCFSGATPVFLLDPSKSVTEQLDALPSVEDSDDEDEAANLEPYPKYQSDPDPNAVDDVFSREYLEKVALQRMMALKIKMSS